MNMKILFLPKEFPHGKVIGGPILIYNRIKYLSKNNSIGLASFIKEEDKKYLYTLKPYLSETKLIPYPPVRSKAKKIYDFFFSPVPNYMCNTKSRQMYDLVADMTNKQNYDVVIAEYTVMSQYLYKNNINPKTKRVISCHESYTLARKKVLDVYGLFSKRGLGAMLDLYRLKKYEFSMYQSSDLVLTLTPQEKNRLLSYQPELNIEVVPHGTDTEKFYPAPIKQREKSVAFLGNYPHHPNSDAVIYFIDKIWHKIKENIPDIKFYIIGRGPTKEIINAAKKDKNIIVTGEVDDVRNYLKKAMVFIAPLRLGFGFRGKTLEAMSMGIPVVTTSLGSEGIEVRNMSNIIIADEPDNFAESVIRLFKDEKLYAIISKNSRKTIEDKYSYKKGVEKLEIVLINLIKKK